MHHPFVYKSLDERSIFVRFRSTCLLTGYALAFVKCRRNGVRSGALAAGDEIPGDYAPITVETVSAYDTAPANFRPGVRANQPEGWGLRLRHPDFPRGTVRYARSRGLQGPRPCSCFVPGRRASAFGTRRGGDGRDGADGRPTWCDYAILPAQHRVPDPTSDMGSRATAGRRAAPGSAFAGRRAAGR